MELNELFPESLAYTQESAAALALPGGGGVYLLTDGEDRFVQLAAAADLKRTLTSRLGQVATAEAKVTTGSRKRADLREIVRTIRWRRAYSMFEITWEYYRLARLLMPETYLKQVGFGPCWFVHVDPTAEFPRFQTGKLLRSPPGFDLGPMATQADAGLLVEILEDAFDLCRYYQVLQQAPHGQPCAYLDMGKCPAPCDGRVPMATYRAMITSALAFACGEREAAFQHWEAAMRKAAMERAYERAGAIKQTLERARRIEHEAYRLLKPIEEFRYLIVQRGAGSTQVKPFFVSRGVIEAGASVKPRELLTAVPLWLERVQAGRELDPGMSSEQMWLISHFLFKREPPGLYLRANDLGSADQLAERVRDHFASKRQEEMRDINPGGDPGDPERTPAPT